MKTKTKIILMFISVIAVAVMLSMCCFAAPMIVSNGTCGDNLTWTLDSDGLLTISGTGAMTDFNSHEPVSPWGSDDFIKSVKVESGVTTIGDEAFQGCSNLTSVELPEGLTSIGRNAFTNCTSLTNIELPKSLTSLGGDYSAYVFASCTSLQSIVLPEGLTKINGGNFLECSGLINVTIPESVTSIDASAFYSCSGLTDVYYAGSEEQWNAISIHTDNPSLTSAKIHFMKGTCGENLTWTLNKDGLLTISGTGAMTDFDYHEPVSPWEYDYFIKTVIIGNGVATIGALAFNCCINLTSITLPETLTTIGRSAFENCTSLANIELPKSLTSPDVDYTYDFVFSCCTSLQSIVLPEGLTKINAGYFEGCSGLINVTIPESVTSIDERAFNSCSGLTDVFYSGSEEQWNAISINTYNTSLTSAKIHFMKGTCGENLTWTLNKDGLLTISGTGAMTDFNFHEPVSPWGSDDFIKSVKVESGVTTIGDEAFQGCSNLTSVELPEGLTSIGRNAFTNCTSLTNIELPKSLTSLGGDYSAYVFDSCTSLQSIILPEGLTKINGGNFQWCSSLINVTIPESVTSIDACAFYGCSGLTDVYYAGSETQWNAISIHTDNPPLTSATIHYSVIVADVTVNESLAVITGQGTYPVGSLVTVYAGKKDGSSPIAWIFEPNGIEFTLNDELASATFIMPGNDVTVTPVWKIVIAGYDDTGIPSETTAEDLKNLIYADNSLIRILTPDRSSEVASDGLVGTGCVIQILTGSGEVLDEKTIIVKGDANGDGISSNADIEAALAHILDKKSLDYIDSFDCNDDNEIDITDVIGSMKP